MTETIDYRRSSRRRLRLSRRQIPVLATAIALIVGYVIAGFFYRAFFTVPVAINLLQDNATLGVIAVGMTFVILSGGIDLSVGAAVAATSIALARLIENNHWNPAAAMALALLAGTLLGAFMGSLIHFFALPAFLVTLGGLFFYHGVALLIGTQIEITHPWYVWLSGATLPIGIGDGLPLTAAVFLIVLAVAVFVSLLTPFGRNVYAIGGNEQSALLMGLPVARAKVSVYALSGFCSALGGVISTVYSMSGDATRGAGAELDAIAAVVVGGTLLSGGVGYVAGTLLGLIIFGLIQDVINFQGNLNTAWTHIAAGALLLAFILLQKLLQLGQRAETG